MDAQELSAAALLPLAERLAREMASRLPDDPSPILIVDSPFAVQALKLALAEHGWPGAQEGAPLPWCGTLEQAFDRLVDVVTARTPVGEPAGEGFQNTAPRLLALRQAHLAQLLLDHPGLGASLGGSAKAALDLAGQWVSLFEGWEWLSQVGFEPRLSTGGQALAAEIATLKALAKEHLQPFDRVPWVARHAPEIHRQTQSVVWFCMGQTPSAKEIAMAQLMFGVQAADCRIFVPPAVTAQDLTPQATRAAALAPQARRRLIAAHNVEESAWSAAQAIAQWRALGLTDIGVVPLDRKAVRRLRALLDRAGEPFTDRTGWSLDTTVAASAVTGLSELLCHRATTQSLLEWIHGPFVTQALRARFGFENRQALDAALRGYGRVAPIRLSTLLAQGHLPDAAKPLAELAHDQRLPLHDWIGRLQQALALCGLEAVLAEDAAGQALLSALQGLQADSSVDTTRVSATLWQAVLSERFAQSRFAEPAGASAVRVCSISSLMWRPPQALVIMGAESSRLPERSTPRFFDPSCLAEMGLIVAPEQRESELLGQFASAWASPYPIDLIACSDKPDSEVEFSGWIELLALHPSPQIERHTAAALLFERPLQIQASDLAPSLHAVWSKDLPETLTVSALQSLADCSYQFYLQTLLGLKPVVALQEESPPSDLGSLLHLVLKNATHEQPSVQAWSGWLKDEINRLLTTSFFQSSQQQAVRLPLPANFRESLHAEALAIVPGLAQWLSQRPSQSQVLTEYSASRSLDALGLTIKGRIDRMEQTPAGLMLIDFKTTRPEALRRRVKTAGDDVQLPLYAWLLAPSFSVDSAAYVSLRRDEIATIPIAASSDESVQARIDLTLAGLSAKLTGLRSGQPIQLEGMEKDQSICDRCQVRGICRRDDIAWADDLEEEAP